MAEYYVQNGGDDTSDGASGSLPWETVEKARQTASVGDEVYFRRGDVFQPPDDVWTFPSGTIIGAYGNTGSLPILLAAPTLSGWVLDGGNVYRISSFTQPSSSEDMLWENGFQTTRSVSYPAAAGTFWLDDPNDILYYWATDGADPSTHQTVFSLDSDRYRMGGNNGQLIDVELRFGSVNGAIIGGESGSIQSGWKIDRAVFSQGRNYGLHQSGSSGSSYTISRSVFTGFRSIGCNFDDYATVEISETEFSYNQGTSTSSGLLLKTGTGSIVQNSHAHHNQSYGFEYDPDCIETIIQYCTASNNGFGQNDRAGFGDFGKLNIARYNRSYDNGIDTVEQLGAGYRVGTGNVGGQVYYNVAYGNQSTGVSCTDGGPSGSKVWNNTIYDNGRPGALVGAFGIHCSGSNVNYLSIKNNILQNNYASPSSSWTVFDEGDVLSGSVSVGVEMDTNLHHISSSHTNLIRWGGVDYATLAAFTASHAPSGSLGNEGDALMVDPDNQDFQLVSGSPCINSGSDVGLVRDFIGNGVPK